MSDQTKSWFKLSILYLQEAIYPYAFMGLIFIFSLILWGVGFLINSNILEFIDYKKANYEIAVYLKQDADRQKFENEVKDFPYISGYKFVSSEKIQESIGKEGKKFSNALNSLSFNPFPITYIFTLKKEAWSKEAIKDFSDFLSKRSDVDEVDFEENWVNFLVNVFKYLETIKSFVLSIILTIGLCTMILAMINCRNFHKAHIQRLKLIGAGKSFIRAPFIFAGIFIGGLSSIAAVLLLYVLFASLPKDINLSFLAWRQIFIILGAGFIIPLAGNLFSIKN